MLKYKQLTFEKIAAVLLLWHGIEHAFIVLCRFCSLKKMDAITSDRRWLDACKLMILCKDLPAFGSHARVCYIDYQKIELIDVVQKKQRLIN